MTLHWWMHWFWVTLWFTVITGIPMPSKIRDISTTSTTKTTEDGLISSSSSASLSSTVKKEEKGEEEEKEKEDNKFSSSKMIKNEIILNSMNNKTALKESVIKDSVDVKNDDDDKSSSSLLLSSFPKFPIIPDQSPSSSIYLKQNFRVPKAIGVNPSFLSTSSSLVSEETLKNDDIDIDIEKRNNSTNILKNDLRVDRQANNDNNNNNNNKRNKNSVLKLKDASNDDNNNNNNNNNDNRTSILAFNNNNHNNNNRSSSLPLIKKDSKVTWILTGNNNDNNNNNQTFRNDEDDGYRRNTTLLHNDGDDDDDEDENDDDLAVLPLQEPIPTRFKLVLNKTKIIPSTNININDDYDKLFNKSQDVEISDDIIESRLLATAASILQGVSESPRLSRARSAFPGDYQQDEQQERKQDKSSENSFNNSTNSAIDIAAVTGSCLATLVLIGTVGSLGFVMYRRRYLNPPQTLNSDKCSNPDSSGYIDDSTIRDNSEEMYSLDNDSFLNSLEAMTIQNYWTDSVKHTKL